MTATAPATAELLTAMGGVAGDPATFRATWGGHTWHAYKIGDTVHLSRVCSGCWATGAGYAGMWSTRRHHVEEQIDVAVIAAVAARIARLRAAGEHQSADASEANALRVL